MIGRWLALAYLMPMLDNGRDIGCAINANRANSRLENHSLMKWEITPQLYMSRLTR